ncbi:hypothetical protein Nepgr_022861 [Nepenthes gracilis]|uniref:Uncharacterized protein n=1 Tax=Nepenthes gracilis TaxID=150966 RepID=A0AAD3T1S3_NEPGR|nr:hypothetical protein Nepgr_022861 [Nepenthes gracilis]
MDADLSLADAGAGCKYTMLSSIACLDAGSKLQLLLVFADTVTVWCIAVGCISSSRMMCLLAYSVAFYHLLGDFLVFCSITFTIAGAKAWRSSWLVAAGYEQVPPWWFLGLIPLGPRVIRSLDSALLKKHLAGSPMAGFLCICLVSLAVDAVLTFTRAIAPLYDVRVVDWR